MRRSKDWRDDLLFVVGKRGLHQAILTAEFSVQRGLRQLDAPTHFVERCARGAIPPPKEHRELNGSVAIHCLRTSRTALWRSITHRSQTSNRSVQAGFASAVAEGYGFVLFSTKLLEMS